jgi:hypothetical protein
VLLKRPSHATVVAYLALFVALGGGAYAALKVTSADIVDKTIRGRDVKPNALGSGQINEGGLRLPQLQAGRGDETALTPQVILSYPKQGFQVETDGDGDTDNSLVLRNIGTTKDINFVTSDLSSSYTLTPGHEQVYVPTTNRLVEISAAQFGSGNPTRALDITCSFPIGDVTFCDGIDVKP